MAEFSGQQCTEEGLGSRSYRGNRPEPNNDRDVAHGQPINNNEQSEQAPLLTDRQNQGATVNKCTSKCTKKVQVVLLILSLFGIVVLLWVCTYAITSVVPPPQDVDLPQNTGIIFATDIGPRYDIFMWLMNLSTRWYTSFDIKLTTGDLATLQMYAVPSEKFASKDLTMNLTCTCGTNLKQCTIEQLPDYGVAPVNIYLFADYHFTYNVCVSSTVSDAITLQAHLFEISNKSDYDAYGKYLASGNATSAIFSSDSVIVEGIISKQTCVVLSINVPKSASYIAVTKITAKPVTGPILYMKQCTAIVPDFSGVDHIQNCLVNSDHPACTVPMPGHKDFFSSALAPQMLAIMVRVSPPSLVPTKLQINATPTNYNIFWFVSVTGTIAAIIALPSLTICVTLARYLRNKNTSQ